jgi:hypothetical protein
MQWAATKILSQDWSGEQQLLHTKAKLKLEKLIGTLEKDKRTDEATKLKNAMETLKRRDLTVILSWQPGASGDADLELQVKEPTGTVCSSQVRQTPGGGVMTGLNLTEPRKGTYVACQAFSGEYQITVSRLWGQPAGGKFRLEVIYHDGTPQEKHQVQTLTIDRDAVTVTIKLANGRRTELAAVVPPVAGGQPSWEEEKVKGNNIMGKLRDMADPVHSQLPKGLALGGKTAKGGLPVLPNAKKQNEQLVYQNGLTSSTGGGMYVTSQAHVSADGQYVRLSVNPVFQPQALSKGPPQFDIPLIPGGGQ